jgi:glycolate oxidase iron-sulfur subunit
MEEEEYIRELSRCIRCGSCKAFCPTYDEAITETMGARGRLLLLWGLSTGVLKPSAILKERIFSCILCGACSESCPSGVDIQEVIYHGRSLLRKHDSRRSLLRLLTKCYSERPEMSFRLLKILYYVFPSLFKGLLPSELPERALTNGNRIYTVPKKKGRVAIFTGCLVNFLYPHLGELLINILQRFDYEVILPVGEVCCGIPLRGLGLRKEAVRLAKKNMSVFKRLNAEAVLSLCPTCVVALRVEYPKLIGEGLKNAMDIASFFANKIVPRRFSPSNTNFTTAFYHDPCHLRYGLGVKREPRDIIRNTGITLIDKEGQMCCGFGGLFSLYNKELSQSLLEKCSRSYSTAEAETIITSCPGCMMQLSKELKTMTVLHLIEIMGEVYANKK